MIPTPSREVRIMEQTEEKVVRFGNEEEQYDLWVGYERNPRLLSINDQGQDLDMTICLDECDCMEGGSFLFRVDEAGCADLNQLALEVSRTAFRKGEHVTEAVKRLAQKFRLRYGGLQDDDATGLAPKDGQQVPLLPLERSAWPVPDCISLLDQACGLAAEV